MKITIEMTDTQLMRVRAALRLRAEACEENKETREARQWRLLLSKFDDLEIGGTIRDHIEALVEDLREVPYGEFILSQAIKALIGLNGTLKIDDKVVSVYDSPRREALYNKRLAELGVPVFEKILSKGRK